MATRPQLVTERVVQSVASHTDTDPMELPPLNESIDPDVLNGFLSDGSQASIRFEYAGCDIIVRGDGSVDVTDDAMPFTVFSN